jgi:uncharacterized membrane protein
MDTNVLAHRGALRSVRFLSAGYLGVSVLTLGAIVLLRNHSAIVNSAVWIRGTIVVLSALLTTLFAAKAAAGSRGAYRRLRIISVAMIVAIAVIISLPGTFPVWLKLEQAVCAALLVGMAVVLNSRHVRSLFATG